MGKARGFLIGKRCLPSCSPEERNQERPVIQVPWNGVPERVKVPYMITVCFFLAMRFRRVELLGSAAPIGWYTSSKAKYGQETDSEQVP